MGSWTLLVSRRHFSSHQFFRMIKVKHLPETKTVQSPLTYLLQIKEPNVFFLLALSCNEQFHSDVSFFSAAFKKTKLAS